MGREKWEWRTWSGNAFKMVKTKLDYVIVEDGEKNLRRMIFVRRAIIPRRANRGVKKGEVDGVKNKFCLNTNTNTQIRKY